MPWSPPGHPGADDDTVALDDRRRAAQRACALSVPRGSSRAAPVPRTSTGAPEMPHDPVSTWYDDFFTELPNAFWRAAVPPEATDAEVDFLVRAAGLRPGYRCSTSAAAAAGTLSNWPGAATGSPASTCRPRPSRTPGTPPPTRGWPRPAGRGHARPAHRRPGRPGDLHGQRLRLPRARRHPGVPGRPAGIVRPGGALVLDYGFVAESMLPGLALEEEPMTIGGVEADVGQHLRRRRTAGGSPSSRSAAATRCTAARPCSTSTPWRRSSGWSRRPGSRTSSCYGDPDGSPYRLGSPRLLLVARRR